MIKLNLLRIRSGALCLGFCALLGLAALAPRVGLGASFADLYQAAVPVTDHSENGMSAAFQSALKIVLIRVTGRRSAAQDPALAPLIGNARRYMQQYRAGAGNQVWVSFDGAALERWLAQNGQPLWGKDRPATAAWVGVPNGKGSGSVLTREDASELKHSLDLEASVRGIALIWPGAAEVQRTGVTFSNLTQGPATAFVEPSKRLGADGVLVGRVVEGGAGVRWTFLYKGRSAEFSGAAEGVDRAADAYAGLFAASGESTSVPIEVTGVGDLQTYAGIQNYLESLTLISRVDVAGFDNDTMRLRVVARGGSEAVQRALSQDSRLESSNGAEPGILRFHVRR
jgi:hypothetical protein